MKEKEEDYIMNLYVYSATVSVVCSLGLFVAYLITLSVAQTMQCPMTGC
jgi:hypothetical protein